MFSRRSRNRLLKLFARLDSKGITPIFVTLTYPAEFPNPKLAKEHLRAFMERIRRKCEGCDVSGVWRMEFQQRGAPHFHVILFGLPFIGKETIQLWWAEITGNLGEPFTRIEAVQSKRKLMSYVSKYVSKVGVPGGFNHIPYLHEGKLTVCLCTGELIDAESIGRWWGIFQKQHLPYAELMEIVCTNSLYQFHQFKRGVRRHWFGCNGNGRKGFFTFVDHVDQWLAYWYYCAFMNKNL
jgi:hypothetical protein